VEGDLTDTAKWWGHRYSRAANSTQRLAVCRRCASVMLAPCGHMLHHDQPEALAARAVQLPRLNPEDGPGAHAKIAGFAHRNLPTMDIEHINSIGTLLADLSARTEQLRGYL
jgi:hypothetical protein